MASHLTRRAFLRCAGATAVVVAPATPLWAQWLRDEMRRLAGMKLWTPPGPMLRLGVGDRLNQCAPTSCGGRVTFRAVVDDDPIDRIWLRDGFGPWRATAIAGGPIATNGGDIILMGEPREVLDEVRRMATDVDDRGLHA